jgi:hypothetical protein
MIKKMVIVISLLALITLPMSAQNNGSNGNGQGYQNGQNNQNGQGFQNGPGNQNGQGNQYGQANQNGQLKRYAYRQGFSGGLAELIASLPLEDISNAELDGMLLMREEEKLARDVYLAFYDTWRHQIFENIAVSEQRHMDGVLMLLDRYQISDPILNDQPGVFSDQKLQNLYNQLVGAGMASLEEALRMGATIEDLDIFDLENLLAQADNSDIRTIYQNLVKGSRNHLRAFVRALNRAGGDSYTAVYLSQAEVEEILDTPMERGIVDENGEPIFGSMGW